MAGIIPHKEGAEVSHLLADVRCMCGKIVAQRARTKIYIKCRHCKRFIIIDTREDCSNWETKYR
ncbi:MAG: hypothetical protein ACOY3H_08670 [Bacillota bacterium]|uniref:Uncharacterized protein n=2 Tax=Carboxydocella TaxID=178898 RepID=A0A1T4MJP2_9FIRM|nr:MULTISPECIES: hypothetical protein [Carboxydocella]AVX21354.1 hypothetical protein CFE_2196 [Carboxydocella thermautotrophica]AVX31782.1 hypothetical protein CTH_2225 [Carboxydocella thermautotrophica]SJZ67081.1 hypothetical protein SAMN02745885_00606 [Carboxydocella sporoproducens DSM 16521]